MKLERIWTIAMWKRIKREFKYCMIEGQVYEVCGTTLMLSNVL